MTGKFITIGVLVVERREGRVLFADARFVCDAERILAFDADADLEILQAICRDIQQGLHSSEGREVFLRTMQESFSNSIQLSDITTQTTADPAAEVEALARLYLAPAPPTS